MPSLALHVITAVESGKQVPRATFDDILAFQWEVWFEELRNACPDRITSRPPERATNRNRLRIEGDPSCLAVPRCKARSPDGRGLVWLLSGGDASAYGACRLGDCHRATKERGT